MASNDRTSLRRIRPRAQLAAACAGLVLGLAAGSAHAITPARYVGGWGSNDHGQLGNGFPTLLPNPTLEFASVGSGLDRAISIAAGFDHTVAIKKDGTVWAWGSAAGAGNGSGPDVVEPQKKLDLVGSYVGVAAGGGEDPENTGFSFALRSDGTVYSWGTGGAGQLGDGSSHSLRQTSARQVLLPSGVTQVVAGAHHGVAVAGGLVFTWGATFPGNGSATSPPLLTPVQVPGLTNVVRVGAAYSTSFAVRNDGTLWGWGDPYFKTYVSIYARELSPVQIPLSCQVVDVESGEEAALALCSDGTVWVWGVVYTGSSWSYISAPSKVPGLANIVRISTGGRFFVALEADGSVWTWGKNVRGALGDGTTTDSATPVRVVNGGFLFDAPVYEIAAGSAFTAVLAELNPGYSVPLELEQSIKRSFGPLDVLSATPIQSVGVSAPFTAQLFGVESTDPAVFDGTVYPAGTPCLASCGVELGLPPTPGFPLGPTNGVLTIAYVDGSQAQLEVTGEMRPPEPATECSDGIDDDGDGLVDLEDPGCTSGSPPVPDPTRTTESPACSNGSNDDSDATGLADFDGGQSFWGACSGGTCPPGVSDPNHDGIADPDPDCIGKPWRDAETPPPVCGLGGEVAVPLALLSALRRRLPRGRA